MPDPTKECEDLRRQARKIEDEIDGKLLLLSKCDVADEQDEEDKNDKSPLLNSSDSAAGGVFTRLSNEIESLLERLSDVNNKMVSLADHIKSPSATFTLQRHRDILNDYSKEFRKTRANIQAAHDRQKLFVSSHSQETRIQINPTRGTELLTREQESVRNTELLVDEQIDTVLRTRESLMNQKAALKAIHSQMTTLANRFPMINSLIQRINIKKRKDSIILASIIGVCLFLLLLFSF